MGYWWLDLRWHRVTLSNVTYQARVAARLLTKTRARPLDSSEHSYERSRKVLIYQLENLIYKLVGF